MEGFRPSPAHAAAHDVAARYRRTLLNALGLAGVSTPPGPAPHPALAWAASGAMALTGRGDGPPLLPPSCVATCADAALQTFAAITRSSRLGNISGSQLLGERAAIAGHRRGGQIAPGGSCRLLRARDHWVAVNLAREDDVALIPAWLEIDADVSGSDVSAANVSATNVWTANVWGTIEAELARHDADAIVERGRALGLPLARLGEVEKGTHWTRIALRGADREIASNATPLVIDLSSLWAGPLATHLLERAGARVIKVESTTRPDGARRGSAAFYDLLNAGKQSVALDFRSREDLALLDRMLRRADIVVEASRPRALQQLGFDATEFMRTVPGLTWLSITGYGRDESLGNRIAFGDDAAVAGGLVVNERIADDQTATPPVFCGDAIADPLTGIHAALAAYGSWRLGGGRLLDIAMANVASHVRGFAPMPDDAVVTKTADGYTVSTDNHEQAVEAPIARAPQAKAAAMGEHTRAVVEELC